MSDKHCGCIEDGRPCAKACGLDMTGWICARERTQPSPVEGRQVNYVSEVRGESPIFRCLSCDTEQSASCKICGALLVEKVSQPAEPAGLVEQVKVALKRSHDEFMVHVDKYGSVEAENNSYWQRNANAVISIFDQQLQQKLEEALAELSLQEKQQMSADFASVANTEGSSGWDNFYYALYRMFASRRARLGRKKGRVEIEEVGILYYVNLDGKAACLGFHKKQDAERYAAGLRAEVGGEKCS